jgi:hypothetical protein
MLEYREVVDRRSSRAMVVLAFTAALTGCGVASLTYPSPIMQMADVDYLHMYVAPEQHDRVYPPTGVRFRISGLEFAVWSPRGNIHGGISRAQMPDPVCASEEGIVYAPPIPSRIRQKWETEHFEIEIAISDKTVSFDTTQVTITTSAGQSYRPTSLRDLRHPVPAWILRFDVPCVANSSYVLVIGGVTKAGSPVDVPPIRFAPTSTSSSFGP